MVEWTLFGGSWADNLLLMGKKHNILSRKHGRDEAQLMVSVK